MIPEVVYVNKTMYKEEVADEDDKTEYTSAAIVWSIFFVILLLLVPASCFMFIKTRKQVVIENADLKKLEEKVALKRGKLGENQLLIEKNTKFTPTPVAPVRK
jgi:nitric oxide reductase large subunit